MYDHSVHTSEVDALLLRWLEDGLITASSAEPETESHLLHLLCSRWHALGTWAQRHLCELIAARELNCDFCAHSAP